MLVFIRECDQLMISTMYVTEELRISVWPDDSNSAVCSLHCGCRTTQFLTCRAFVRKVFSSSMLANAWLCNYDIWYSFFVFVFVFGLELETQPSHYETLCFKRFLLKSLLTARLKQRSKARWFKQRCLLVTMSRCLLVTILWLPNNNSLLVERLFVRC